MNNSDMPAMPIELSGFGQYQPEAHTGLTKREQVLKDFMVAILSNPNTDCSCTLDSDILSKRAMRFTDSYFKELER